MDTAILQYAQYPLLRCGVAFLLFSIVCFLNYYSLHGRPFWKWLGLFIFFLGLHDALHLSELLIRDQSWVDIGAVLLLGAAIFVFLEIICDHVREGRRECVRGGGALIVFILLFLSVVWGGWRLTHSLAAFFVPLLVGAGMFVGMSSLVKEGQDLWQKSLLRLSMLFVGLYVLTLTILPSTTPFSIGPWNKDMFLRVMGFPVPILSGILIMAATVVLWIYHIRVVKQRVSEGAGKFIVRLERIFIMALSVVLLTGWFLVSWVEEKVRADERRDLLSISRLVTAGVNPRWVEKMTFTPEDRNIPEVLRLREEQMAFGRALSPRGDVRWIYIVVMRQGKIIFATDSVPQDDPNYSAPGDVYADAPEDLYKVFQDGKERIVGPYRDQWGTFVSGFVPIRSFDTGGVIAVEGVDVDLAVFITRSFQAKIQVIGVLMLIVIFMGGFFLWRIRTREAEDRLKTAFDNLQGAKDELEKTQNKLGQSEKLAAIGTLAAGVAHEINNPLGFIQGNLTVLSQYVQTFLDLIAEHEKIKAALDESDMSRLKEIQHVIREFEEKVNVKFVKADVANLLKETIYGVERINKIVTALQHFSYASSGAKQLVRVNDALEGIMNMVMGEVAPKAELVKDYGDIPPVEANEEQLKQVFINLLLNAAQAINDRGVIRLNTYVKGGHAVIEVADTGCGISKEALPKIFDPFFTTKEPGKGTGLGLSISYDIIRKHKGRIEVESESGKGTVFRVFLPLAGVV